MINGRRFRIQKGVRAFATPMGDLGALTGWYRQMLERGNYETIIRSMRTQEAMGIEPYLPCLDTDLSPEAAITCGILTEQTPNCIEAWMTQDIEGVTSHTLRQCEAVYEHFGEEYVLNNYCPVAWATRSNSSETELREKIAYVIHQSGTSSTPLYNVAVSDESYRLYRVSMPVVWMRRAFLRTFRTGNELINIYRMMGENITRIYDIPAYREE